MISAPNRPLARPLTRVAAWLLAATVCLAPAIPAAAQDKLGEKLSDANGGSPNDAVTTEPVAIVTLGSINQLTQDLNYISGAIGQPQLGFTFAMMAGSFTQGIDTNKPIGVIVPLVDGAFEPIALIPANDIKTVLKTLEAQTGPADELDDGTLVIAIGANTIFIRQVGPWAILASNRAVLDQAPADPGSLLTEMGGKYDIAVKLDIQQVPASFRDALIGQLRQGFEQAMARQGGEDGDDAAKMAGQQLDQLEQVISQTDDFMFGFDIDSTNRRIVIDGSFTALPGSDLARLYGGQQPIPSAYSMVIRDDAAMYLHSASSIGPDTIEQARNSIDQALAMLPQALAQVDELSESDKSEVSEMINRIVDLVVESYSEGKSDIGALLLADDNDMQFVLGTFISDGDKAAQIVKDIAAKIKDRGDAPRFEFDRDTYKGVTLHLVEADVPEGEDEVRKVFGEKVRLHIGTAEKALYVALGDNSLPLMMKMVDQAATPTPPAPGGNLATIEVNLMPILKFAKSIENNDAISSMLDALARADDPGQFKITTTAIPNGQTSRFIVGDGLIKAIGAAVREAQAAQMQNGQF